MSFREAGTHAPQASQVQGAWLSALGTSSMPLKLQTGGPKATDAKAVCNYVFLLLDYVQPLKQL